MRTYSYFTEPILLLNELKYKFRKSFSLQCHLLLNSIKHHDQFKSPPST